jgi:hypothetical protein
MEVGAYRKKEPALENRAGYISYLITRYFTL